MSSARAAECLVLCGEPAAGALTTQWDEMVRANPRCTVFQTSHWYQAWLSSVACHECAEPVVLMVPGRAGLALQISRLPGECPTIRPLSAPWADYHEAVGDLADAQAIETIAAALIDFARNRGHDLALDEVVPGGMLAVICSRLGGSLGYSSQTLAIELTNDRHVDEILSRNEHAIKWRRLNRRGAVRCLHRTSLDEILPRLPVFIEMHRKQWSARVDAVAPFDGAVVDRAFESMARGLAPHGMVSVTELLLDDHPIAMYFGFIFNLRYLAYRTSFDASYGRLSPGHAMIRQMILDFRAAGLHELDLMRGAYAYKGAYTNRISRNLRLELRAGGLPAP